MEFSVSQMLNVLVEIANAGKYPKIRLLSVAHEQSVQLEEESSGIALNWTAASPINVGSPFTSPISWLYDRLIYGFIKYILYWNHNGTMGTI